MTKDDAYRQKAAECQTIAAQCKDITARELWLETARTWQRIADIHARHFNAVDAPLPHQEDCD